MCFIYILVHALSDGHLLAVAQEGKCYGSWKLVYITFI